MSKKILILETSVTLQKLFTTTLDSDFSLQFVPNGKELIFKIFDSTPDVVLLNVASENPGSFETVRILRAIPCLKSLPIGLYTNSDVPFAKEDAEAVGANSFVKIEPRTLLLNIDELSQVSAIGQLDRADILETKKAMGDAFLFDVAAEIIKKDRYNESVLKMLFAMANDIESADRVLCEFLSLIAEFCEVPAITAYLVEHDGPHAYALSSKSMTDGERADFFKVCTSDFEDIYSDSSLANLSPKFLESETDMDQFYSAGKTLSSYLREILKDSGGKPFGTVHIVRDGNFSKDQADFFSFCCKNASILIEKTLMLKKKMFFEQRIRHAFGRFVPKEIIDDLVVSDETEKVAVGEKRQIAVLFSDIRSFTNISERNKPEVMVSFLNRYFSVMCDCIKKYGGTVDKFIGDAIMALFGAPVSYEDNSRRAVAAAYEMRNALETLDMGDLILPEGMKFNIGIGIHYGDVIAGSLGSKEKTDYTVIGDSVNLASRLEGLTKVYGIQVLVSEDVKKDVLRIEGAKDEFVFRYLDNVRVKGKDLPVPIFAVDRSLTEFSAAYRDSYAKAMELYQQGIFNLAKEYFGKALSACPGDKAALLMIERCEDFIKNPPENWDGAIKFTTK